MVFEKQISVLIAKSHGIQIIQYLLFDLRLWDTYIPGYLIHQSSLVSYLHAYNWLENMTLLVRMMKIKSYQYIIPPLLKMQLRMPT